MIIIYTNMHVNKPTRGRGSDTPNLLDLIMTNGEQMITDIDHQSPLGKSDHSVFVTIGQCMSICMGHSGGDRYFIYYGLQ